MFKIEQQIKKDKQLTRSVLKTLSELSGPISCQMFVRICYAIYQGKTYLLQQKNHTMTEKDIEHQQMDHTKQADTLGPLG